MSGLESMLVGALITWVVAWFYYKRAGDELRQEAKHLQTSMNAVLYFLEKQEANVVIERDSEGRVTRLLVSATGNASGNSEAPAGSAPKGTQRRTKKRVT